MLEFKQYRARQVQEFEARTMTRGEYWEMVGLPFKGAVGDPGFYVNDGEGYWWMPEEEFHAEFEPAFQESSVGD